MRYQWATILARLSSMKPLPQQLTIGSGTTQFTMRQLIRKGMHAVYEQWQRGRIVAYEVIRIKSHNGYFFYKGQLNETYIEPAESMPVPEDWGTHVFTFGANDKAKAVRKMVEMMTPRV